MKRLGTGVKFKLIGLVAWSLLTNPQIAVGQFGGPTYCVNCSTSWTQLLDHAQLVLTYLKEAQTALNAITIAQQEVREGQQLYTHPLSSVTGDLNLLSSILIQSQGLAGSMGQMDATFRQVYTPYAASPTMPYYAAYNGWANTTLNTILGTIRAAGMQGTMLQNEQAWMMQVQNMMQSPMGRNEALQLGNAVATEEVAQLQKLRQLMLADMQSKAAYTAYEVNQQQAAQTAAGNALAHTDRGADPRAY